MLTQEEAERKPPLGSEAIVQKVYEVSTLIAIDCRKAARSMLHHRPKLVEAHEFDLAHLVAIEGYVFQTEIRPARVNIVKLPVDICRAYFEVSPIGE